MKTYDIDKVLTLVRRAMMFGYSEGSRLGTAVYWSSEAELEGFLDEEDQDLLLWFQLDKARKEVEDLDLKKELSKKKVDELMDEWNQRERR